MRRHSYLRHGPGMAMQCSLIMAPGMMIAPARLHFANDGMHDPLIESPKKNDMLLQYVLYCTPASGREGGGIALASSKYDKYEY